MSLKSLLLTATVLLCATPLAHADNTAPPAPGDGTWCQQNPDRCEKARERLKAKCDADPAKCEEAKQKLQEKAAECQANPDACKEKAAEFCKEHPDRPVCKRAAPPAS